MLHFLKHRNPDLVEWMDRADCDLHTLNNTYRQFSSINSLFSGWRYIYKTHIRPLCKNRNITYTLLDIGFGGGDIPIKLSKWAKKDGISIQILAIELDERALDFVHRLDTPNNVQFKYMHSSELIENGITFDFVISNHVLHHLKNPDVIELMLQAEQLAKRKIIFSDIERNVFGYFLFKWITPLLFKHSYIQEDGLISIQRSFSFDELESIIPKKWTLDQMPFFRLLLTLDKT